MAYTSGDEIKEVISLMIGKFDENPEAGEKLRKSNMVIQVNVSNMDFSFTLNFRTPPEGKMVEVLIGANDLKPDVTVNMKDDAFNKFWQGKLDPMMGMAQGELKASGDLGKMVNLLPSLTPIYAMYVDSLKTLGKDSLII